MNWLKNYLRVFLSLITFTYDKNSLKDKVMFWYDSVIVAIAIWLIWQVGTILLIAVMSIKILFGN